MDTSTELTQASDGTKPTEIHNLLSDLSLAPRGIQDTTEEDIVFQTVPGMASNMQFMIHEKVWDRENVLLFEGQMCIALAKHLLRQDFDPSQMLIVTTTNAQKKEIELMLAAVGEPIEAKNIGVEDVRDYLNLKPPPPAPDILIFSPCSVYRKIRNPFLSSFDEVRNLPMMLNYMNACQQNKRLGMYIVGHASLLDIPEGMKDLCSVLWNAGVVQNYFTLRCTQHQTYIQVSSPEEIDLKSPNGGCTEICSSKLLNCDHECPFGCHGMNSDHKLIKCQNPCEKRCPEGHPCDLECGSCEPCLIPVNIYCASCNETVFTACSQRGEAHTCEPLPATGDIETTELSDYYGPYRTNELTNAGRPNATIPEEHGLEVVPVPGLEEVASVMPPLEGEPEAANFVEAGLEEGLLRDKDKLCGYTLSKKGHECPGKADGSCTEKVELKYKLCGHKKIVDCGKEKEKEHESCEQIIETPFEVECGHIVSIPCFQLYKLTDKELARFCTQPCKKMRPCGHLCTGLCNDCNQGVFHVRCKVPVEFSRGCGHTYIGPCSDFEPCKEPCTFFCEHGKCELTCGVPCTPCKEPCIWKCPHFECGKACHEICDREPCWERCPKLLAGCGHPCIGYCGLPCPILCATCDKDKLTDAYLLGEEFKDTDNFIALEACGHILEKESMDLLMKISAEANVEAELEQTKKCPFCRAIIWNCRHYNEIVNLQRKEILDMKFDLFGDPEVDLEEKVEALVILTESTTRKNQTEYFEFFRQYLLDHLVGTGNPDQGSFDMSISPKYAALIASFGLEARKAEKQVYEIIKTNASAVHKRMLHHVYHRIFSWIIERPFPPTTNEVADYLLEMQRATDMYKLFKVYYGNYRHRRNNTNVMDGFEIALHALQLDSEYSGTLKTAFRFGWMTMSGSVYPPVTSSEGHENDSLI